MKHAAATFWRAVSRSRLGGAGRVAKRRRACPEPCRRAAALLRVLLAAALLWLTLATNALAAGVVGSGTPPSCVGDCGNDGQVTVDEILTMVNIALGNAVMSDCDVGDENDDGQITIDEILRAVNSALNGCPILDVSGTRQRDQAVIGSSTCAAAVTARVQSSIDAGEWNCTYDIAQSGPNLTITETCPDGTDTFPGTVDSAGRITVVRTEQKTQDSCTFTETSRFEADGSASSSTGTGRLQFHFSAGCAFTDCEIVVESRFSRP